MVPKGIGVFFLTIIVGAEVIQTHDNIKANLAVKRLTRSERLASEQMAALEASMLEEELREALTGPEAAWQEANKVCKSDGTDEGCRCTGQLCEPGQCTWRPLPNDWSKDESCRLSEAYMLDSGRVLYFLELQTNVLHLKAEKYADSCASWWKSRLPGMQTKCARRTQQMLFATQFIAKANEPEVQDQMSHNQRARMQESYSSSAVVMAEALGKSEDKLLVNKLIQDAKTSEVLQKHTMVTVRRMVATIKDLISGDEAAKAAAKAYIEGGSITSPPTAEELEADTTDVEREMTPAEVEAEQQRGAAQLDGEVEALSSVIRGQMSTSADGAEQNSLLEVRTGSEASNAAKMIGYALLILLAVLGVIFILKETVAAIATWILMVLLGCTVYHIGHYHGRREALAEAQAPPASSRPPKDGRKSGLLEVEAGGLVTESEAAAARAEAQFPWGKLGACYVKWFVLPFVLIGRAVVWVWRKVAGTPAPSPQLAK